MTREPHEHVKPETRSASTLGENPDEVDDDLRPELQPEGSPAAEERDTLGADGDSEILGDLARRCWPRGA